MTWNPESEYCHVVRAFFKAETKEYWRCYRLPGEINRLADLTRTTIAREMRKGRFPVATCPSMRDAVRRGNETAQKTRFPSGVTDTVCIGERKIQAVVGSYYRPQPLEYVDEERKMLYEWTPDPVEQATLF